MEWAIVSTTAIKCRLLQTQPARVGKEIIDLIEPNKIIEHINKNSTQAQRNLTKMKKKTLLKQSTNRLQRVTDIQKESNRPRGVPEQELEKEVQEDKIEGKRIKVNILPTTDIPTKDKVTQLLNLI